MAKPKLCDCPYKEFCHLPRQQLQLLFRKRDNKLTIYDCEFHGAISERLIGAFEKIKI